MSFVRRSFGTLPGTVVASGGFGGGGGGGGRGPFFRAFNFVMGFATGIVVNRNYNSC
jgi:hypothetical protein